MRFLLFGLLSSSLALSCKKTNESGKDLQKPPVITSVRDLPNRTTDLSSSNYGDWIVIKGQYLATTYKVDFNGILASDSLIFADDTSITVKIPQVLPDPSQNPITVTTKYGIATYNYKILQPPPTLTSFDPMGGPNGQEVTLTGLNFGGVTSVKFDTATATIISSTKTQIKVTVPTGVSSAYIYVSTPSGTVKSDLIYGYKYVIYDDALGTGWSNTSFSTTAVVTNTTPTRRGTNSVKCTYTSTFGGFRFSKATPALATTGFSGLKFSVWGNATSLGKKIKVYFNGLTASSITLTIPATEKWIDFQVPMSNLGNLATITSMTIQEFSGVKQDVFYDDIVLY